MNLRVKLWAPLVGVFLFTCDIGNAGQNPINDTQHVVSLRELNNSAAQPAIARQSNEAAVRHLLSSQAGQQALKSASVDYQRVDQAIGQLSDEDLARLAQRARQAESDFAAGFLSPKHLA